MKDPLNIVFFPHSVNYGLAGTNRLQNIIHYLRKEENITISNIALEDKSKLFDKGSDKFIKEYAEVYYGPSVFNFITHIFITIGWLHKFKKSGSGNLLYFYDYIDIKNFFFVLWARLIGYKVVVDVVEDRETVKTFKSFFNKLKYKSSVYFLKNLSWFADGVIVISTHIEDKIKLYCPKAPIFFLPVTYNTYLFQTKNGVKKADKPTVFYSGSFNDKDGLPFLLEALAKVKVTGKSFSFVLSGMGTPAEMELFWSSVKKFNLADEVDYRGFLSRADYMKVLTEESDILCVTRVNSAFANAGFPFKLGEFLATGKPVIVSKVGDIQKYLSTDQAYLIEPGQTQSIAEALMNILNDREEANRRGINGKAVALHHFGHDNYATPLVKFFNKQFNHA